MPSSGSVDPEPFRVTLAPAVTVRSGPAAATGGELAGGCVVALTDTLQVSVALWPKRSLTVRRKVRVVKELTLGDVKVAVAVEAPERVTDVPAVCVQAYEAMPSSASVEFKPLSVTVTPPFTVWSAPALATGG
jgi:hypothetical protein